VSVKTEVVFVVEEDVEDGGFVATAVGESIFTQGSTIEELRAMVRDAVQCHFEPGEIPPVIRLHFARDEALAT
jgi:predicted RNase H-like HicB family nuclease